MNAMANYTENFLNCVWVVEFRRVEQISEYPGVRA